MRMMRSMLSGDVVVQGAQVTVSIGPGGLVDVDQLVADDLTVGEALGDLLLSFADLAPKASILPVPEDQE